MSDRSPYLRPLYWVLAILLGLILGIACIAAAYGVWWLFFVALTYQAATIAFVSWHSRRKSDGQA